MIKSFISIIILISIFLFSCKDDADDDCKKKAMSTLLAFNSICSDPNYRTAHGYADYDACIQGNFYIIAGIISDCPTSKCSDEFYRFENNYSDYNACMTQEKELLLVPYLENKEMNK